MDSVPLPDGWRSGHIDRQYLVASRGHLVVADVVEMGVALYISLTPTTNWGYAHLEVRQAVNTSALLFPFPGPAHSAGGAGRSSRVREDPATGPS